MPKSKRNKLGKYKYMLIDLFLINRKVHGTEILRNMYVFVLLFTFSRRPNIVTNKSPVRPLLLCYTFQNYNREQDA